MGIHLLESLIPEVALALSHHTTPRNIHYGFAISSSITSDALMGIVTLDKIKDTTLTNNNRVTRYEGLKHRLVFTHVARIVAGAGHTQQSIFTIRTHP